MNRYETIKFKDFSDGKDFDRGLKNSFESSDGLILYKKDKNSLGADKVYSLPSDYAANVIANCFAAAGQYIYFIAIQKSDDKTVVVRVDTLENVVVQSTFNDGDETDVEACFFFKSRCIVSYCLLAGGYKQKSTADFSSWTDIADFSRITDYVIVGDNLYILDDTDKKIYVSGDGLAFTEFISLDSNLSYSSIEYISGFFSVVCQDDITDLNFLISISVVSKEIKDIHSSFPCGYIEQIALNDIIYLIFDYRKFYSFSGDKLEFICDFDASTTLAPVCGFAGYLCLYDNSANLLYFFDISERFFNFIKTTSANTPFALLYLSTSIQARYCLVCDTVAGANLRMDFYSVASGIVPDKFESSGDVVTEVVNEGKILPKQIILKHDPLPAGTSVKVYVKEDKATAWGSAVIDSDTDNAVSKTYDFPKGSECDFIQFKIELLTSDNTETPENAQLDFIYKPIGLTNSK